MRDQSTANLILALGAGFVLGSFCQTQPLAANADSQPIVATKQGEQKASVRGNTTRLQFDKQARVHHFSLHSKQDLTLDQGF